MHALSTVRASSGYWSSFLSDHQPPQRKGPAHGGTHGGAPLLAVRQALPYLRTGRDPLLGALHGVLRAERGERVTEPLPFDLWEEDDDEGTVWAIKVTPQMTRGKARAYITRTRGVQFTEGSIGVGWLKRVPDSNFVQAARPHESGAVAYWVYEGP